jgi:proteasome assembly chaperone (PAC2) family protein
MASEKLQIFKHPVLKSPRLLVGLSGWMDSGEVSTGTIRFLVDTLGAESFAQISSDGFFIESFPGSMEMSALFRPYAKIQNGLIKEFWWPENLFFFDQANNLLFFLGREPNFGWKEFAECIFSLCSQFGVEQIYFVGSVAGLLPHTREPLFSFSVSAKKFRQKLQKFGLRFINYQGPASIVTYLTVKASDYNIDMASLVATVPAYVQGSNPICIEAVIRRLLSLLGLHIDIHQLRISSDEFERRLTEAVQKEPELVQQIHKMEENYDNEVFDDQMGDLKHWLVKKGIRLD